MLTRHLSYYALVGQEVSTTLAMRIITVRRLWLENRSFVAVRMSLTAPARVTGDFVAPNGSIVPGQTIRTPTRHAGVTILRVPLRITKPGLYKLQMHADGLGQVVNRTAKIRFLAKRPASPVWQDGAVRVAVVHGVRGLGSLGSALGKRLRRHARVATPRSTTLSTRRARRRPRSSSSTSTRSRRTRSPGCTRCCPR